MRAAALALLAGACALAGGAAHAGSLTVRDGNNAWTVNEDQSADSNDFVLRHLVNGTLPDERFGRREDVPELRIIQVLAHGV